MDAEEERLSMEKWRNDAHRAKIRHTILSFVLAVILWSFLDTRAHSEVARLQ
jgi:hypothetical protein